jgi:hypothetical protein
MPSSTNGVAMDRKDIRLLRCRRCVALRFAAARAGGLSVEELLQRLDGGADAPRFAVRHQKAIQHLRSRSESESGPAD